jgi:branched-subunit amino acid ABC-type transport system permease component
MPDWVDTHAISVLNGLAIGSLLFILAVGLSLVFGMMDVLNLAHGAVYLVGAYVGFALTEDGATWLRFVAALAGAAVLGGLLGCVLAALTQPLRQRGHLDQALLTLGAALVLAEGVIVLYGDDVHSVGVPAALARSVEVLGTDYPTYRLVLIAVGAAVALALYLVVERTRLGALIRATVADRQMVEALGVDSRKVLFGVFGAGAALAAVAGVLGGQIYGARPGLDENVLILALVVVVIGGLGSIRGALVGALLIGQVESLGRALLPDAAPFLVFGTMALVLLVRPTGLFGSAIPERA